MREVVLTASLVYISRLIHLISSNCDFNDAIVVWTITDNLLSSALLSSHLFLPAFQQHLPPGSEYWVPCDFSRSSGEKKNYIPLLIWQGPVIWFKNFKLHFDLVLNGGWGGGHGCGIFYILHRDQITHEGEGLELLTCFSSCFSTASLWVSSSWSLTRNSWLSSLMPLS